MQPKNACLMLCSFILLSSLCGAAVSSKKQATQIAAIELAEDCNAKNIAKKEIKGTKATSTQEDAFLESYIQGCVDTRFPEYNTTVTIRKGQVILTQLPKNQKQRDEVIAFVRTISAVDLTNTSEGLFYETEKRDRTKIANAPREGIWLPQSTVLFPTQIANPRQISFSIGHRMRDKNVSGRNASAISFGDQFPLYRWSNVGKSRGDLQLEIEGGVFGVFNQDTSKHTMINSDYYVGIPLSYAVNNWAFRLRGYHISSHLGDEYMISKVANWPKKRRNKSFEAIDFFTACDISRNVRLYGGVGIIAHSDSEMHMKPLYIEYGMEARAYRRNFKQVYGQPFIAMHIRNWQDNHFKFDSTVAIGYEWGKLQGVGRKIRTYLSYHEGYSLEGQFSRKQTRYIQFTLSYGF